MILLSFYIYIQLFFNLRSRKTNLKYKTKGKREENVKKRTRPLILTNKLRFIRENGNKTQCHTIRITSLFLSLFFCLELMMTAVVIYFYLISMVLKRTYNKTWQGDYDHSKFSLNAFYVSVNNMFSICMINDPLFTRPTTC